MKRKALILALLLCQPAYAQSNVEDIGVKTGGYNTEEPQLKPALPEPKKDLAAQPAPQKKKIGFWKKFHPDHIETYHPKLNRTWNGYMFVYEHGGRQTLDITSKVAQIAFPFVAR